MKAQVVKTSTPKRLLDWLSRQEDVVDSHLICVNRRINYVKVVVRRLIRFPRRLVRPCCLEEIALNCPCWFGNDGAYGWHPLQRNKV